MKSYVAVAFFALLAVANASVVPAANILQGPSSRTTLVGPEGSVISSVAPGGAVVAHSGHGVVAHAAPVVAHAAPAVVAHAAPAVVAHSAYAAPAIAHAAPLAYSAPIATVAHAAPLAYAAPVAHAAPVAYAAHAAPVLAAHGRVDAVLSGPSGTVAASRAATISDIVGPHHGVYAHGW